MQIKKNTSSQPFNRFIYYFMLRDYLFSYLYAFFYLNKEKTLIKISSTKKELQIPNILLKLHENTIKRQIREENEFLLIRN